MGGIASAVSGIFGGGGDDGGQQVQERTTTTTNQIDPMLRPYVQFGLDEAKRLYESSSPSYFPGKTYVEPSATTLSASAMPGAAAVAAACLALSSE